ncbi:UNVERIFIED_CONTAM: hypothetical protein K2H54_060791 [Gekko kuhli]
MADSLCRLSDISSCSVYEEHEADQELGLSEPRIRLDALERLSDKVATMMASINERLQEINAKLEAIAEEARKVKDLAQCNAKELPLALIISTAIGFPVQWVFGHKITYQRRPTSFAV